MDIIDYTRKFQNIEINFQFFSIKDGTGLLYWDLIRYEVFNAIYYELAKFETQTEHPSTKNRLSLINKILSFGWNYIKFIYETSFRKRKYICFVNSRSRDDHNNNIDLACHEVLSVIQNESLIIETYMGSIVKSRYASIRNAGLPFARLKYHIFQERTSASPKIYEIAGILEAEFNIKKDLNSLISTLITKFNVEYNYYFQFLKRINPVHVFMVQNGVQKGLVAAAKACNIPIVEVQHGQINYAHPAYSYPYSIKPGSLNTLPDTFFCFSKFWTMKINYPVSRKLEIGNSFYAQSVGDKQVTYQLTIIFANIYTNDLTTFTDKLLRSGFSARICIKLHPNQLHEAPIIRAHFASFKNVDVICNEYSTNKILSLSEAILAIQSTFVYEALQNKVKVFLYKSKNYRTHEDVFDDPNLYLVENETDLINLLDKEYIPSADRIYFKKFDADLFNNYLKEYSQGEN